MREVLSVAIGGAIGAASRYKLSGFISRLSEGSSFPLATLTVNLLGCFAAGIFIGLADRFNFPNGTTRLFLLTGILGGFTTFSAFGVETLNLLRQNQLLLAGAYIVSSVCFGFLAVWLGFIACRS